MKLLSSISGIVGMAALAALFVIYPPQSVAQEKPQDKPAEKQNPSSGVAKKAPTDPLRTCAKLPAGPDPRFKNDPANDADPVVLISDEFASNVENPQEKYYREEMLRLLKMEIRNVNRTVRSVEAKHKELIRLYPQFQVYQEIMLEDVPGAWRGSEYVSVRQTLSLGYNAANQLECIVLDAVTRPVYNTDLWTRKLLRVRDYSVQTMEMETLRHNYRLYDTLDRTSPEVQVHAFRVLDLSLRAAVSHMDMMIAAYQDNKDKRNLYQIQSD
ncbi:MAG: hypothetical protein HY042_04785 [Spirochaetia bacterium]|nr:hypothetical protein [Spirochaetia bacterium]